MPTQQGHERAVVARLEGRVSREKIFAHGLGLAHVLLAPADRLREHLALLHRPLDHDTAGGDEEQIALRCEQRDSMAALLVSQCLHLVDIRFRHRIRVFRTPESGLKT